jgi:hypothetical protein
MNNQFTIKARQTVFDEEERQRRLAICFSVLLDGAMPRETAVKAVTAEASDEVMTDEAETKNAPE